VTTEEAFAELLAFSQQSESRIACVVLGELAARSSVFALGGVWSL